MRMRKLGVGGEQGSSGEKSCPNIFELENGDFAIVGTEATQDYIDHLPPGTKIAEYESIVHVPRYIIETAIKDIT